MSDIEYHKEIVSLLGTLENVTIDFSHIEMDYNEDVFKKCQYLKIETEQIQARLRLITNSIQTKVFQSVESFLKIKEINNQSNFLIYKDTDIVSYINEKTFLNYEPIDHYFLISNTKSFLDFKIFLKEQEKEIDGTFHFVDSYNKDFRKIIFVSFSEKGRLNITYDPSCPYFDEQKDYRSGFERYKSCFVEENSSLTKFLKSATINLVSNFPKESRFKQYFESLNEIVDKARINFEVYLNELSIDKIKKDYDDVKSKYFNGLSDILSKLSHNIIILPIEIAAVLFAVEKIKTEISFLFLLIVAILITSVYVSLLLRVHFKDLIYIQKVFKYDYEILIENNFFKKYPQETFLFLEIKLRINDRVRFLKLIIESYFWVMNLANIVIVGLLFSYLKFQETAILIITFAILIILAITRNYIFDISESEEKNSV
ncbi:MAG: hypothetical protein IM571_07895 [Chitinophagaceae bacterium]|jgi:hypothetical protein|nr:hypothetical protein [Chitinophagaceae bacterium]